MTRLDDQELTCTACREPVAFRGEENHVRLMAMQVHDHDCEHHGRPCTHEGECYRWEAPDA